MWKGYSKCKRSDGGLFWLHHTWKERAISSEHSCATWVGQAQGALLLRRWFQEPNIPHRGNAGKTPAAQRRWGRLSTQGYWHFFLNLKGKLNLLHTSFPRTRSCAWVELPARCSAGDFRTSLQYLLSGDTPISGRAGVSRWSGGDAAHSAPPVPGWPCPTRPCSAQDTGSQGVCFPHRARGRGRGGEKADPRRLAGERGCGRAGGGGGGAERLGIRGDTPSPGCGEGDPGRGRAGRGAALPSPLAEGEAGSRRRCAAGRPEPCGAAGGRGTLRAGPPRCSCCGSACRRRGPTTWTRSTRCSSAGATGPSSGTRFSCTATARSDGESPARPPPRGPSRLVPAAAPHAAVSVPQAGGGRAPGQLARELLGGESRGHIPVPDRGEPQRRVRAAPAGWVGGGAGAGRARGWRPGTEGLRPCEPRGSAALPAGCAGPCRLKLHRALPLAKGPDLRYCPRTAAAASGEKTCAKTWFGEVRCDRCRSHSRFAPFSLRVKSPMRVSLWLLYCSAESWFSFQGSVRMQ